MTFQLWDASRGEERGQFETRELALEAVLTVAESEGEEAAAGLMLAVEGADGHSRRLATGWALLALAAEHRHHPPGTRPDNR